MAQNEDLVKALEKEIEIRILPKQKYPYVPASAIRSRLNEVFGCLWNTRVISHKVINDDTVLLLLELSATVGDNVIKKEAFGSAPIHKYTSGINKGKPVNLGDAYGNAVMDSLKACSKQLCIGNKEMDVTKDPITGEYVRVSDIDNKQTNTSKPVSQDSGKQSPPKQAEQKVSKPNAAEKNSKIIELKKRLAASKKKIDVVPKTETVEKKEEQTQEEPVTQTESEDNSVVDHGFDYGDLGGTTASPKNTQKLVILNLAKMKGVAIEDYIEQIIGKQKSIDELTASEAGLIVRSGLTSTTFKE